MRFAGHVTCIGKVRNVYNILVRQPEGKKSLGRPSLKWEDNIKMDLKKDVDLVHLSQDRDW
jgi:hypothetical protein